MPLTLCADKLCPSKNSCFRFTNSKKLAVATWGRVKGMDKCGGYVKIFPEIEHENKSKKSLQSESDDIYC